MNEICLYHYYEVLEDVIHHGLERGWTISEAKEHHQIHDLFVMLLSTHHLP